MLQLYIYNLIIIIIIYCIHLHTYVYYKVISMQIFTVCKMLIVFVVAVLKMAKFIEVEGESRASKWEMSFIV